MVHRQKNKNRNKKDGQSDNESLANGAAANISPHEAAHTMDNINPTLRNRGFCRHACCSNQGNSRGKQDSLTENLRNSEGLLARVTEAEQRISSMEDAVNGLDRLTKQLQIDNEFLKNKID